MMDTEQVSVKAIAKLLKPSTDPEAVAYGHARKARFHFDGHRQVTLQPADDVHPVAKKGDGLIHSYARKEYEV